MLTVALSALVFSSAMLASTSIAFAQSPQAMEQMKVVTASGSIANNQIQDGKVSWIQGGNWRIKINSQDDLMTGSFSATFAMVKPDGTFMHKHSIKNYVSETVLAEGGDLVMTGTADIYSGSSLEYPQAEVVVHIMGKNVLGLTIDNKMTEGHFASSSELYGIMTRSRGLDTMLMAEGDMNMESGMKMDQTMSSSSKMTNFSSIKVTKITKDSAIVEGMTSNAVMCQVEYGQNPDDMDKTATDSAMIKSMHKNHSVMLKDLEPNTTYSYRFKATMNGDNVYSDTMTFTTLKG